MNRILLNARVKKGCQSAQGYCNEFCVHTQFKILFYVVMLSKNANAFIIFIGEEGLLIPLLAIKILKRKVILMPGCVASKAYYVKKDPLSIFASLLAAINFSLVDRIAVYSPLLVKVYDVVNTQKSVLR